MTETSTEGQLESWQQEVRFRHRWGQHGEDRARQELQRLQQLRDAAEPFDDNAEAILAQIVGPEICDWRLEDMVLIVCEVIGQGRPAEHGTAGASLT